MSAESERVLADIIERDFDESNGVWFHWCKTCDASSKEGNPIPHVDGCLVGALASEVAENARLREENEQWRAQYLDDTAPQVRPMTRLEHRMMDLEQENGSLELANARLAKRVEVLERVRVEAEGLSGASRDIEGDLTNMPQQWLRLRAALAAAEEPRWPHIDDSPGEPDPDAWKGGT